MQKSDAKPDITVNEPGEISAKNKKEQNGTDWHIGRIFWGLLLVVVGGLMLADNLGYLKVSWVNIWQLWPLTVIAAGLSVLSVKRGIWNVIITIFMILIFAAVVFVAVNPNFINSVSSTQEIEVQKTASDVKSAEVSIETGASDFTVGTANQEAVLEATLNSNMLKLTHTSVIEGSVQKVALEMNGTAVWNGSVENSLSVNLTRNLPLDVSLDFGATNANIDLSKAYLNNLSIDAGASSINLRLGDKTEELNVNVKSGVSSIVILVPKDSGVQLVLDHGLTSKDLGDLKIVNDNTYESASYKNAEHKINIVGSVGLSSFKIERY